jgi:hypothetical protein
MTTEGAATAQVQYPSDSLPPVPSFAFVPPEGWNVGEMPGALGVISRPGPQGSFWTRFEIRHERVDRGIDIAAGALASFAKTLLTTPDAELDSERH